MTKDKTLKNMVTSIRESFDDESIFIDIEENSIIKLKDIYMDYITNEVNYEFSYPFEEKEIKLAKKVIIEDKDNYIRLPKLNELFHIFSVMDEFIQERLSEEERDDLLNIIGSNNRYNRFVEAIQGTDLEVLFEIFLSDKIEYEMKKWLQDMSINY